MNFYKLGFIVLLFVTVMIAGCSAGVQFGAANKSLTSLAQCVGDNCGAPAPVPVNETYQVPAATGKADILFVMDTTPSMFLTIEAMATRLSGFFESLNGLDWQVGISNASLNSYDSQYFTLGELLPMTPNPNAPNMTPFTIFSPQTADDDLFDGNMNFHYMTYPDDQFCAQEPYCTTGPAQPMNEIISMINNRSQSLNQGFFRPGAYLVPIIITASDENGGKPLVQPSDVVSAFNQNLGSTMAGLRAFTFDIQSGDSTCLSQYSSIFEMGSGGSYGPTISSFAATTGGQSFSVCDSNYTADLSVLAQGFGPQVTTITLQQTPLANSLVITAPNVQLQYTLNGNVVTFSQALPTGTVLSIYYEVMPSN